VVASACLFVWAASVH